MMELPLDGFHIGIDIRVVVFEVVEDRGKRPVVHELRALVEERGVVLVRFDDEERVAAEPRARVEIGGHAADEKSR
jgi:hypothetical protein